MPHLILCIVAFNDETTIEDLLRSTEGLLEGAILLDQGSDATTAKFEQYCLQKDLAYQLCRQPFLRGPRFATWFNFLREKAREMATQKGLPLEETYALMMEAGDLLTRDPMIPFDKNQLIEDSYMLEDRSLGTAFLWTRIVRVTSSYQYKGDLSYYWDNSNDCDRHVITGLRLIQEAQRRAHAAYLG